MNMLANIKPHTKIILTVSDTERYVFYTFLPRGFKPPIGLAVIF
jgi:hypothetical protein